MVRLEREVRSAINFEKFTHGTAVSAKTFPSPALPSQSNFCPSHNFVVPPSESLSKRLGRRALTLRLDSGLLCHHSATAMSNTDLSTELVDHIVDLLYDSRDALKSCCLVPKLSIPRARMHLFARIKFTHKHQKMLQGFIDASPTEVWSILINPIIKLTYARAQSAADHRNT